MNSQKEIINIEKELYMYKGFKLVSLRINGNPLLRKSDLYYNFIEPDDQQESIYTTVIIGPNGTGKSNLFRIIIDLFKILNDLSKGKPKVGIVVGYFNIKYSLNGDLFEFGNFPYGFIGKGNRQDKKEYYLRFNEKLIDFSEALLPLEIIANSISITDKFPFFQKETTADDEKVEVFKQYKYLGVRNIAQNASTRAYVRRTVEFVVNGFQNRAFRDCLLKATNFLELDPVIKIIYFTTNTSKFFTGTLTPTILKEYFDLIKKKYPKPENNPPFKLNQYLKIIKDDEPLIDRICDYCNQLYKENRLIKSNIKHKSNREIIFNLFEEESLNKLRHEYQMIEHLRQLGMISTPEIRLVKGDSYSLQESSSGEYNFFSAIVGLLATIKKNSLVLIDEPEISLHPNWQMRYLSFLRELFSDPLYSESHILVATHSHFLISDLKGESSKIIGLKKTDGKIEIVNSPKDIDTFGWSAEDVLYRVFEVRTTRNYYMGIDIRKLLFMISHKSRDKSTLNKLLNRLERVKLTENDPLNKIIAKAKKYTKSL